MLELVQMMISLLLQLLSASSVVTSTCTFGQDCWPSDSTWSSLNRTLSGHLYRARPPAYVCHAPSIDEAACNVVKANWTNEFWRSQQPGGYFDTAWENGDTYCNIDNDPNVPCAQGLVPIYVAKVQNVSDVQAAVKFAKDHSLSTRVKGASHDFLGRSSGNGTFGISTVDLKGIVFDNNYQLSGSPDHKQNYSVVHVGAGEYWYTVNKAANDTGVQVVGGTSYSVGAAGGWVLGGGHSSLSPQYGLGVDNVLEFEIVTPDGQVRIANQYKNTDLFWALRGGGGGFGVVTKVTYKTYPAITGSSVFIVQLNYTAASYPAFLRTFLGLQPALAAGNFSGYNFPSSTSFSAQLFVHNSPNYAANNATLQPLYTFAANETAQGRTVSIHVQGGVLTNYMQIFPFDPATVNEGAGNAVILGSRLLPISSFQGATLEVLIQFLQLNPFPVQLYLIAGGKVSTVPGDATAIHPSWRRATHHLILGGGWDTNTNIGLRNFLRQAITLATQALGAINPDFGCYINEADANEPNWSDVFWGSNYPRLKSIKSSIDPQGLFTCHHCVGYNA